MHAQVDRVGLGARLHYSYGHQAPLVSETAGRAIISDHLLWHVCLCLFVCCSFKLFVLDPWIRSRYKLMIAAGCAQNGRRPAAENGLCERTQDYAHCNSYRESE